MPHGMHFSVIEGEVIEGDVIVAPRDLSFDCLERPLEDLAQVRRESARHVHTSTRLELDVEMVEGSLEVLEAFACNSDGVLVHTRNVPRDSDTNALSHRDRCRPAHGSTAQSVADMFRGDYVDLISGIAYILCMWEVEFTREFGEWWRGLSIEQ